jgi:hypothetical protein
MDTTRTLLRPAGRLCLRVWSAPGQLVAERRGHNMVLRGGAAVIAGLFAGKAGSEPINFVEVGFGQELAAPDATSLTPPNPSLPVAALRSPVAPGDFALVTDRPDVVQVVVSSVFHPTVVLQDVTEAGLMAGDRLYNQVVFEPVTLRPGQDVTFFWEIDFPFGH